MNLSYFHYFQYLSLFAALLFYRGLKSYALQWMIPLLLLVCIVETSAKNVHWFNLKSNYVIYNIYVVLSIPLYLTIFFQLLEWKAVKKIIYFLFSTLLTAFGFLDVLIISKGEMGIYSVMILFICQVLLSCLVLSRLAMSENREVHMLKEPHFWFAAGVIIFALGTGLLIGLLPYIRNNNLHIFGEPLYRIMIPALNVVLYSCYTYAFYLCMKHKPKLQLS